MNFQSEFMLKAKTRGFIYQCTDSKKLDTLIAQKKNITAYVGFDPTSDSLHAGNLLPIMMLRLWQKCGHKPIIVIGGGTAKVGDPAGKIENRKILSIEKIQQNIQKIKNTFLKLLNFNDKNTEPIIVDNSQWLDELLYIPFLRDFAKVFSVNRMINLDTVKNRLRKHINLSFLEFNYMVMQAYDFFMLSRKYDCRLQMGGADQWGNIVCGIELARKIDKTDLYGLTSELITTASGDKMGKTQKGAVWLDENKIPPWQYWQYWRNCNDQDVPKFLRLFTELDDKDIAQLEKLQHEQINDAKKILADEATKIIHGKNEAIEARILAQKIFEKGQIDEKLPVLYVQDKQCQEGIDFVQIIYKTGLSSSLSEAKRLIKGRGARIFDEIIDDLKYKITQKDFKNPQNQDAIRISAGRKKHAIIRKT